MNILPFEILQQTTTFYFLRHGESEGNRSKKMQGHHDAALTETGREQAGMAGKYLADMDISRVFSSPLSRALETATIVADTIGLNPQHIEQRKDLMEIDTGIFSGLSFAAAEEKHPEEWKRFQQYSWEGVPSAERIPQLLQRATLVWQELIKTAQSASPNILCVSHGGILNWIVKRSMAAHWTGWVPVIRTKNCGIHALKITPLGKKDRPGSYYSEWKMVNHLPY